MLLYTEEDVIAHCTLRNMFLYTVQISELRRATLGWVLCNNLQFSDVQLDVFRVAGPE